MNNLNVSAKTINLVEKTGVNLHDLEFDNVFLNMTIKKL